MANAAQNTWRDRRQRQGPANLRRVVLAGVAQGQAPAPAAAAAPLHDAKKGGEGAHIRSSARHSMHEHARLLSQRTASDAAKASGEGRARRDSGVARPAAPLPPALRGLSPPPWQRGVSAWPAGSPTAFSGGCTVGRREADASPELHDSVHLQARREQVAGRTCQQPQPLPAAGTPRPPPLLPAPLPAPPPCCRPRRRRHHRRPLPAAGRNQTRAAGRWREPPPPPRPGRRRRRAPAQGCCRPSRLSPLRRRGAG